MSAPINRERQPDAYRAARERIQQALRAARSDHGLTQEEWGMSALGGSSRFVVNRLEVGTNDLKLDQALLVDRFIGRPTMVPLVEHRDRVASGSTGEDGRDILVQRLLATDEIRHLRITLADDLDIAGYLHVAVVCGRVDIIVPSPSRAKELVDGEDLDHHIERQIAYLLDIQDLRQQEGKDVQIRIFESDLVLFSMIHVSFNGGEEVAYWPLIPGYKGVSKELPVVTTSDAGVCERIAQYADQMITDEHRVQPNEAVVIPCVESENCRAQFTRFVPRGTDPPFEPGEGHPVALVLPYAMTVKLGRPVGLRVILHERIARRDSVGKISLLSKRVTEDDIRSTLGIEFESASQSRRKRDPLSSAIDVGRALISLGSDEISSQMYRRAAAVDLRSNWSLVIAADRFREIELPSDLAVIQKSSGQNIVPRLFVVELESSPDPDLGEAQVSRLMEGTARHGSVQYGYEDVLEIEKSKLNSFLANAVATGFLEDLMVKELGIVSR